MRRKKTLMSLLRKCTRLKQPYQSVPRHFNPHCINIPSIPALAPLTRQIIALMEVSGAWSIILDPRLVSWLMPLVSAVDYPVLQFLRVHKIIRMRIFGRARFMMQEVNCLCSAHHATLLQPEIKEISEASSKRAEDHSISAERHYKKCHWNECFWSLYDWNKKI